MPDRALAIALAVLWAAACGDDPASRPLEGVADGAAVSTPDASGDDPDSGFAWECGWTEPDVGDYGPPTYLDLTQAAGTQPEGGNPSSIYCYTIAPRGNITPGGIWFQSWRDPDVPGSGAHYAAGDPFVLEADQDVEVIPPLLKQVGDTVGPGDAWVSGEPVPLDIDQEGVQTAHFQDYSPETAETQVWFTSGIVGVRFTIGDDVHYGFVELEFVPDDSEWQWSWRPVRWGYQPEPDQPLTIPP